MSVVDGVYQTSPGAGSDDGAHLEPADFAGLPVLVAGLGKSGRSAARHLAAFEAEVLAVDDDPTIDVEDLTAAGVETRLGNADPAFLDGCRLLVVGPGLPETHPLIVAAEDAGVPVWSEVELGARLASAPMVGVTGTNGKTTTTELATAMLAGSGFRTVAAGNVGLPLTDAVLATPPPDALVVELSSFQLRFTHRLRLAAAAWLNFAPDHLDWHPSIDAYADAKARIWDNQTSEDVALYPADDELIAGYADGLPSIAVPFSTGSPQPGMLGVEAGVALSRMADGDEPLWRVAALRLPGRHNLANALAASGLALALGANPSGMARAIAAFRPRPHRLEPVGEIGGVTFVNDSKATNPHAAERALTSFPRVVWIAGGRNKGLSFEELAGRVRDRLVGAVLIGDAAEELAYALGKVSYDGPVVQAVSMREAVSVARSLAHAGDTVVLAPGCASFDMFSGYEERGRAFAAAVAELTGPGRPADRSAQDLRVDRPPTPKFSGGRRTVDRRPVDPGGGGSHGRT